MAATLSPKAQAFLKEKVWGHVATLQKSGGPQVSPVWMDTDGKNLVFNTADGRQKVLNMRRDGRLAISVMGADPNRILLVRGRVKEITAKGADDHIDAMALKYTGNGNYQGPKGSRLKVIVEPLHVMERL